VFELLVAHSEPLRNALYTRLTLSMARLSACAAPALLYTHQHPQIKRRPQFIQPPPNIPRVLDVELQAQIEAAAGWAEDEVRDHCGELVGDGFDVQEDGVGGLGRVDVEDVGVGEEGGGDIDGG